MNVSNTLPPKPATKNCIGFVGTAASQVTCQIGTSMLVRKLKTIHTKKTNIFKAAVTAKKHPD